MKKTTLLLAAFAVVSCQERNESSLQYGEPKEIETKTYEQLEKVNWLLGEWSNATPEGNLTETWTQLNDSTFSGKTTFMSGNDTLFTETIEIMQVNDSLLYNTKVSNQNQGKAISFKASNLNGNRVIFENPKHDYPQKIMYNKISADSLVAEISGMKDGKESKETFPMKKK